MSQTWQNERKNKAPIRKSKDRYPHLDLDALSPKDLVLVLVKVQKARHLHLPRRNVKVRVEKNIRVYQNIPRKMDTRISLALSRAERIDVLQDLICCFIITISI